MSDNGPLVGAIISGSILGWVLSAMRNPLRLFVTLLAFSSVVVGQDHGSLPHERLLLRKDISAYTRTDMVLTVRELEFPPSFQGAKHRHPGPLVVCVLEGSLEIALEGRDPKTYSTGQCFTEEPHQLHLRSRNLSTTAPVRVISYILNHPSEPLVLPEK
jgi:quercetin dioxygenase-like cupin family protein